MSLPIGYVAMRSPPPCGDGLFFFAWAPHLAALLAPCASTRSRSHVGYQELDEAKLSIFQQLDAPVPPGQRGVLLFHNGVSDELRQLYVTAGPWAGWAQTRAAVKVAALLPFFLAHLGAWGVSVGRAGRADAVTACLPWIAPAWHRPWRRMSWRLPARTARRTLLWATNRRGRPGTVGPASPCSSKMTTKERFTLSARTCTATFVGQSLSSRRRTCTRSQ